MSNLQVKPALKAPIVVHKKMEIVELNSQKQLSEMFLQLPDLVQHVREILLSSLIHQFLLCNIHCYIFSEWIFSYECNVQINVESHYSGYERLGRFY